MMFLILCLGGGRGMGRILANASHWNRHRRKLENKKALTRTGRDCFAQKKQANIKFNSVWSPGEKNGQGRSCALTPTLPGCVKEDILIMQEASLALARTGGGA